MTTVTQKSERPALKPYGGSAIDTDALHFPVAHISLPAEPTREENHHRPGRDCRPIHLLELAFIILLDGLLAKDRSVRRY